MNDYNLRPRELALANTLAGVGRGYWESCFPVEWEDDCDRAVHALVFAMVKTWPEGIDAFERAIVETSNNEEK